MSKLKLEKDTLLPNYRYPTSPTSPLSTVLIYMQLPKLTIASTLCSNWETDIKIQKGKSTITSRTRNGMENKQKESRRTAISSEEHD